MNGHTPRSIGAALAALLPLLSACGSAPTRVYTLFSVAPAARVTYTGPPVRVDAVHLPPSLDRTEVVSDVTPDEIRIDDFGRWSAPLPQMARQTLSADLVARLPAGSVTFPHLAKLPDDRGIAVDILDFRVDAGGAFLQASWAVSAGSGAAGSGAAGSARRPTVILRSEAGGGGSAGTATALSTLLGQLADRIAADL